MKTKRKTPITVNDHTILNTGDYIRCNKSKYFVLVKEIYYDQRNYDEEYGEHLTVMLKVDIFDKKDKLLATDSIVTIDAIRSGDLYRYIPNLNYDPTYLGNADKNKYCVEFDIWKNMTNRCFNCKDAEFPYIGALGTTVCDRWRCFEYFLADFKHILGYNEDLYFRSYILDIYDIQKYIHPSIRVYAPGYVKLKPFKDSDIYKYRSISYAYNIKYPKDLNMTTKYITGEIDIKQTLFRKQTGINVKLDLDNSFYHYDNAVGYQKPMVNIVAPMPTYVSHAYSPYNNYGIYNYHTYRQPMKEMCVIVEKEQ